MLDRELLGQKETFSILGELQDRVPAGPGKNLSRNVYTQASRYPTLRNIILLSKGYEIVKTSLFE